MLLDSVVVGDPSIHLGLGLHPAKNGKGQFFLTRDRTRGAAAQASAGFGLAFFRG